MHPNPDHPPPPPPQCKNADFDTLLNERQWLLDDSLIQQYYSPDVIFHQPDSVSSFMLPDRMGLPSVVNFNIPAKSLAVVQ